LEGTTLEDGSSAIVGFRLIRDYDDKNYIATSVFGGNWSCTGVNCTACTPTREGGRWSQVNGCNCGGSGDPNNPSYCNHSSNGGGGSNAAKWVTVLIGIIGIFN
jgi:hypothetical protein